MIDRSSRARGTARRPRPPLRCTRKTLRASAAHDRVTAPQRRPATLRITCERAQVTKLSPISNPARSTGACALQRPHLLLLGHLQDAVLRVDRDVEVLQEVEADQRLRPLHLVER